MFLDEELGSLKFNLAQSSVVEEELRVACQRIRGYEGFMTEYTAELRAIRYMSLSAVREMAICFDLVFIWYCFCDCSRCLHTSLNMLV